jgi:serine/threonine protein kinase/cytochrome c-type biogenesis protein CcmH/NrfG
MTTQCPKCNTKNPNDSKFCKECASPLKPPGDVSVTKTIETPAKGIAKGTTIAGKYQILQKIGEGGMGIVYKAKDSRLDRTVALKFLSSDLIKDKEAKKRFIQEAKAAAALEHPNICTVYEVDEVNGQAFIAMSYIEGQSLKDKLKEGPFDVDEAKDIAIQVAEGLKEAHEKGIIHRDIKPANIMLTKKGQAKITDFGLAKLSWGVDLTKTSTVMGTVAYMSPEQAKGEKVDQRTDIWSLGAMLYEMLSGDRPFQKSQEQALIYAILNDKPTPPSLLRSDIPTYIEHVIEKALEKKISERYQNIQKLIKDLNLSISFPKAEKSIVVLPFENLSPDPEQDYFCDGMTEEIISDLSSIQSLRVISRNTAMVYKGTRKTTKTIGRELNIQYVLEGSVRKAGNNLRITAQLIDATNDTHLWAKKYGGTLDDVFDIQEKVSQAIVEALKLKLSSDEAEKIKERPIADVKAYEYYLRAKLEMSRLTKSGLERALRDLKNALEIVGENAHIYEGIGEVYLNTYEFSIDQSEPILKKAEECANKILELDPDSPGSYYLLGRIERFRGSVLKAMGFFKKALAIDPKHHGSLSWLSLGYAWQAGKPSEAEKLARQLIEFDPMISFNHSILGFALWMEGKLDQAISSFERAERLEPESIIPTFWIVIISVWKKDTKKAFDMVDHLVQEESTDMMRATFTKFLIAFKHAWKGKTEEALSAMTDDLKVFAWNDPDFPWLWAGFYALVDERDEALRWLEHSILGGFINYPILNEKDPFLENIRSEPRFKKLLERVKQEWENFEV